MVIISPRQLAFYKRYPSLGYISWIIPSTDHAEVVSSRYFYLSFPGRSQYNNATIKPRKRAHRLLFEMGFFYRLLFQTPKVGFVSRWMLPLSKMSAIKRLARLQHKYFKHKVCFNVKEYSRKTWTLLFTVYWAIFQDYFCKTQAGYGHGGGGGVLFEMGLFSRLNPLVLRYLTRHYYIEALREFCRK